MYWELRIGDATCVAEDSVSRIDEPAVCEPFSVRYKDHRADSASRAGRPQRARRGIEAGALRWGRRLGLGDHDNLSIGVAAVRRMFKGSCV